MIFKRILQYSLSMAVTGALMVSCDKIEEPFTEKITVDTTIQTSHVKRVLLEDYTGHQCVNCPEAALIAHDLKNLKGDQLVVIAVHAGWFAKATPSGDFTADYTTDAGDAWDAFFGISNVGNPNGLVNRKYFTTSQHILSPPAWSTEVLNVLADTVVTVDLKINNNYNAENRLLNSEITVEFVKPVDKDLNLIVVLTESGIVSPQKNNNAEVGVTPIIYDYVHNHMLRDALTGTWGVEVAKAGTANPATLKKNFNYTVNQAFNADNCSIVAFVYDVATKEVLQAVEKQL